MKDFERFFKAFKPRFGRLVMTSNLGRVNKNMRELAKYINREYEKNIRIKHRSRWWRWPELHRLPYLCTSAFQHVETILIPIREGRTYPVP